MENYQIPIENIYYMLCYSWGYLKEKNLVDIKNIKKKTLPNIFAKVLSNSLNFLIKKGFDREYIIKNEEISNLRGNICINESLKNFTHLKGKMICEFDELDYNILQNQIIKTTLKKLILSKLLENEIKNELIKIYQHFNEIDVIEINEEVFKKIKIHKNNYYYGFIINVCKLINKNLIPTEEKGASKFKDFFRDEKEMAYVFENFVRNFYKHEQNKYKVAREDIKWNIKIIEGNQNLLPKMQTDISLINKEKKIVIDTKYYKQALKENFNSKKFNSNNLYQIFSYLSNLERNENKQMIGILIYPQVKDSIDFSGQINDFEIKVKTLNLNQNWGNIEKRLLEIIEISN